MKEDTEKKPRLYLGLQQNEKDALQKRGNPKREREPRKVAKKKRGQT